MTSCGLGERFRQSNEWVSLSSGTALDVLRISQRGRGRVGVKYRARDRWIALIQSIFYLVTGLWPIFHMKSFEIVSGEKTDKWLVKTVGGLISLIGIVLLLSRRDSARREHRALAMGAAAWLTGVDVYYVLRRRISPIYLADALTESLLLGAWVVVRPGSETDRDHK